MIIVVVVLVTVMVDCNGDGDFIVAVNMISCSVMLMIMTIVMLGGYGGIRKGESSRNIQCVCLCGVYITMYFTAALLSSSCLTFKDTNR